LEQQLMPVESWFSRFSKIEIFSATDYTDAVWRSESLLDEGWQIRFAAGRQRTSATKGAKYHEGFRSQKFTYYH
jgi:hypothetical protein